MEQGSDEEYPTSGLLSEVHAHMLPNEHEEQINNNKYYISRFPIRDFDVQKEDHVHTNQHPSSDKDGDLVLKRKKRRKQVNLKGVISIRHSLRTPLEAVGLQIWRGSLVLAEYLLHNALLYRDCIALELGAGPGLTSIALASIAKKVFVTDYDEQILENCEHNTNTNSHLYQNNTSMDSKDVICVRKLDWEDKTTYPTHSRFSSTPFISKGTFDWKPEDYSHLKNLNLILAADVIYEEFLTNAFVETLRTLLTEFSAPNNNNNTLHSPLKAIISLEKRINFALDGKDYRIFSRCYEHFMQHLTTTETVYDPLTCVEIQPSVFEIKKIPIDFPHYFEYERTEYLELWQISLK